jgi:hypothetical protein
MVSPDGRQQVIVCFSRIWDADCLMGNPNHPITETLERKSFQSMRQLNGVYTQRLSRHHGRVWRVFGRSFKT